MKELNINPLAEIVNKEIENSLKYLKIRISPRDIIVLDYTSSFSGQVYNVVAGQVEVLLPSGTVVVQANKEKYSELMRSVAEAIDNSGYATCKHSNFMSGCDCPSTVIYLCAPKPEPESLGGPAGFS